MIAEILLPWQFFELDFMLRNHENLPCNPTHLTHKRKIPGTYRQISSLVCIIMQENIISFVQFSADIIIPKYFRIEKNGYLFVTINYTDWIKPFISLIYKPTFCGEWASDAVRIGTLHFTIHPNISAFIPNCLSP